MQGGFLFQFFLQKHGSVFGGIPTDIRVNLSDDDHIEQNMLIIQ